MHWSSNVAIAVVGILHAGFAIAEIFFWETLTPMLKVFSPEQAMSNASVGRNMGVYNGILAVLLLWLVWRSRFSADVVRQIATVLLCGICIAGLFGGLTIVWTIPLF
jgi:uncharacterized membrane protein